MAYLVEYILKPGDKGYGETPSATINGDRFEFVPNPKYDGRKIVEVNTVDMQQKILGRSPMGEKLFAVPTDILDAEQRILIEALVDERVAKAMAAKPAKKAAPKNNKVD